VAGFTSICLAPRSAKRREYQGGTAEFSTQLVTLRWDSGDTSDLYISIYNLPDEGLKDDGSVAILFSGTG
jgi:hypothetical protein